MVLNDIIEQAAGRQSRTPEQGGNVECSTHVRSCYFFFSYSFLSPFITDVYLLCDEHPIILMYTVVETLCTVFSIDIQC